MSNPPKPEDYSLVELIQEEWGKANVVVLEEEECETSQKSKQLSN